ncbi:MAG: MFS transporter, partial [Planctomycetes bacterium]|nr:MFS transporter [Planctomycetota bacterium]
PPAGAPAGGAASGLNWKEMLVRPLFWLLFVTYFCGVFAGLLVNGLAAPIAIELAGFEVSRAPVAVMLFALASASGRVIWGFLSDILGRIRMIAIAFILTALAMFILYGHVGTPGVYLPCLFTAGLCYGGIFGTFPSLSAESFGLKNAAVNLAILFSSFSLVAILAPQVIGHYRNGGPLEYPKAFLIAGCVAVAGLVLSIVVGKTMAARRNANAQ